jgi:hypothetical protein
VGANDTRLTNLLNVIVHGDLTDLALTLYLGLVIPFSPLIDNLAYLVAGLPSILVYIPYGMRKII